MGKRIFSLLTNLAIDVLALVVVDWLFTGIQIDTWQAVVGGAILLALVNAYLRPLIILLTLPFNILSLGLFTFVINALLLYFVSFLLGRYFEVDNFGSAFLGALVISIASWLLNLITGTRRSRVRVERRRRPTDSDRGGKGPVIDI